MNESTVYIALGANLPSRFGAPPATLAAAINCMGERVGTVTAVSPVYKTEPIPRTDDPWYHNQVIILQTNIAPYDLLSKLQAIEEEFGRVRTYINAPRILDLDVLSYEDLVQDDPVLTLPHPRLHERAFVLFPLQDVAPAWKHPVMCKTISALITKEIQAQQIEKIEE